jgi:hypothetical protein
MYIAYVLKLSCCLQRLKWTHQNSANETKMLTDEISSNTKNSYSDATNSEIQINNITDQYTYMTFCRGTM